MRALLSQRCRRERATFFLHARTHLAPFKKKPTTAQCTKRMIGIERLSVKSQSSKRKIVSTVRDAMQIATHINADEID